MSAGELISICIPTCKRPELLSQALQSCLAQYYRPLEIVVGDDSPTEDARSIIENLKDDLWVSSRYYWNQPPLGQAENINRLLRQASGDRLVLLHDDDQLLPNAVSDLAICWERYPQLTAAYGKQYVISHEGTIDHARSEKLNRAYYRTPNREGLQEFSWFPGIVQQLPNDGYMVKTQAARATPWRSAQEVGNGGDFDFGLRLCLKFGNFFFLNRYTAKYRLTENSMSQLRSDDSVLNAFRILKEIELPEAAESMRRHKLKELAPVAILQATYHRHQQEALRIYWGEFHPWRRRVTLGGVRRLAQCVLPTSLFESVSSTIGKKTVWQRRLETR